MVTIPAFLKEEYPFKQNTLKIPHEGSTVKMNYIDIGEGEPILMVHGNPTWSFYYRNLAKALSNKFRVIVPDHIGCGLSDKPQDYTYDLKTHITNIGLLIEGLGLKKISLIVHDWGGAIGLGLATKCPDNIEKLVITNTAAFTSDEIPIRLSICKTPLFGEFLIRTFNAFAWPATFMAVKNKLPKEIKQGYLLPYDNYQNRVATAKFVQDIPMDKEHPSYQTLVSIENNLHKIKCPKLIVWGREDFCFTMNFFFKWQKIYPEAESHIFKNSGHYVLEDSGEEGIEIISNFFHDHDNDHDNHKKE